MSPSRAACVFAQTGSVDGVQLVCSRHPCLALPHLCQVLSSFPESSDVDLWAPLLDLLVAEPRPERPDDPKCESGTALEASGLVGALEAEGGAELEAWVTDNVFSHSSACAPPSRVEVEGWALRRVLDFVREGCLSNARKFAAAARARLGVCLDGPSGFVDALELGLVRYDADCDLFLSLGPRDALACLLEQSQDDTEEGFRQGGGALPGRAGWGGRGRGPRSGAGGIRGEAGLGDRVSCLCRAKWFPR